MIHFMTMKDNINKTNVIINLLKNSFKSSTRINIFLTINLKNKKEIKIYFIDKYPKLSKNNVKNLKSK